VHLRFLGRERAASDAVRQDLNKTACTGRISRYYARAMHSTPTFLNGLAPLASALLCAIVVGCGSSAQPTAESADMLETERAAADAGASDGGMPVPNGPVATTMADQLTSLGLDLQHMPDLHSLDGDTRDEVMQTFTRALGVRCSGCHDTSDFAKPTPQKKIATNMWNQFVRNLALKDGSGPVYCDSCHQGKAKFLNRHAPLRSWMTTNFVDKLKRTDGTEHNCGTCHGTPFQGDIFGSLWHAD
jgi:hypothetical protein